MTDFCKSIFLEVFAMKAVPFICLSRVWHEKKKSLFFAKTAKKRLRASQQSFAGKKSVRLPVRRHRSTIRHSSPPLTHLISEPDVSFYWSIPVSSPENPLRLSPPTVRRPLQEEPSTVRNGLKPSSRPAADKKKKKHVASKSERCSSFKIKGLQHGCQPVFQ